MTEEKRLYGATIALDSDMEAEVVAQRGYAHSVSVKITAACSEFFVVMTDAERVRALGLSLIDAANALDADARTLRSVETG